MRRGVLLALCFAAVPALAAAEGVQVSPPNAAELDGLLHKLAEQHHVEVWCTVDCATFMEVSFEGTLARGELRFSVSGSVTGEQKALVELFGSRPAAAFDEAIDENGKREPLYWSGSAYSAVLPPGNFRLTGTLRFATKTALTLTVPGPAGLVTIKVADADVVGTGERRGVRGATYQLASKQAGKEERVERLRLQIERRFELARDKTFHTEVSASGARTGQVIRVPLLPGETVEDLDPAVAHARAEGKSRWLDWVAGSTSPVLAYGGKWSADSISLIAAPGAVRETWRVHCDDPYLCSFAGDAEPLTGESGHVWSPLAGQKLEVTWQELLPLAGVHTVAQEVALATHPVGRNLQQRLRVEWMSSSGSQVSLKLPEGALISRFTLDGAAIPILKDGEGRVQIGLPTGRSRLDADWELAGRASWWVRPPTPEFSESVGTLWHRVYPAEGRSVVMAGGLSGSPRVALWPSMGACLVLALALWWLARWGDAALSSTPLAMASVLGFAILHPAAPLPLLLALGLGRFLSRIDEARHKVRIVIELVVWAALLVTAVVLVFATLQHALFEVDPMDVESFVSGGEDWGLRSLAWGTYLAGDAGAHAALPSPWALCVPVVVVRLLWAGWGVVIALFLVGEGRLALGQLAAYWRAARWSKAKS